MNESVSDVLKKIMHRLKELSKYRGHKRQPNLRILHEINILQEVMIRLNCKDHEWYSKNSPRPRYNGGGAGKTGSRKTYKYR
jgi:hypothetical protein